jgi:anti-sigma regulatory factor (Ser/Thr protein kinase)
VTTASPAHRQPRAFRIEATAGVTEQARWPLRSNLELAPLPSAVPSARAHARLMLAQWGLPRFSDDVELVVSELVTNGVRASASLTGSWFAGRRIPGRPPVRLWLGSDRRLVLVQVWDGNHEPPVRREADPEADGGRGLLLVESLSLRWSSYRPAECSGKVVWALLA